MQYRTTSSLVAGVDRLPRWSRALLGAVLTVAGLLLLVRPLTTLDVLLWAAGPAAVVAGVVALRGGRAGRAGQAGRWDLRQVCAVAVCLVGVVILALVVADLDVLVPLLLLALAVSAASTVSRGRPDSGSPRLATWGRWLDAATRLGLVALVVLWPDASLLVVAVAVSTWLGVVGIRIVWRVLRSGTRPGVGSQVEGSTVPGPGATPWAGRRAGFSLGARAVGVVLVSALVATTLVHQQRDGAVDAFYDAPGDLPGVPGQLVRWEPAAGSAPEGTVGYRLLYTTSDADGSVVLASGVLAVPADLTGPAPLITWAHGTVGSARACAPSARADTIPARSTPAVDSLSRRGWAMVAADYPGMGTEGVSPYLVGQDVGRSVLDAARAARQVPGVSLADQTVVWGHSQGGHAALWAGQLASTYAPDLDVVGTAAFAPATDPLQMATEILGSGNGPGTLLAISYVVTAYSGTYDELPLDTVLDPSARVFVRAAAARCLDQPDVLVSALGGLAMTHDRSVVRPGALDGPFAERLAANAPAGPWTAPVLVVQGEADDVVPPAMNRRFADQACASGTTLELATYPGAGHMEVVTEAAGLLERWTAERFAGEVAPSTCTGEETVR